SHMCRTGCDAVESMYHIFVHCATFVEWRRDAAESLPEHTKRGHPVWPLKMPQFYVGQIPSIQVLLDGNMLLTNQISME
ncbi:hypothetical protein B0H12DRAFT_1033813, partial [Mycena haematopus]